MLLETKPPRLVPAKRPLLYSAGLDRNDHPRSGPMKTELIPSAYEFSYAGGRWTEHSPPVINPPRGKARKGQIYILADVDGRYANQTAERLRVLTADAFYRDPSGSLTSALVRAIQQANEELYDENERSIRSDRQYATICCMVIRGNDAFFAMAGRGLAYIIKPERGERF